MPPASPVSPSWGQEAIGQTLLPAPWEGFTSDIPGTTLPTPAAPQEASVAEPQAAPQAMAQAGPGPAPAAQSLFGPNVTRVLQHPWMHTPAGRAALAQPMANAAALDQQIGAAQAMIQMKQGVIERLRPTVEAQINDPNLPSWQKAIMQTQWLNAQLEAGSPTGGFNAASSITPMLSAMRMGMPTYKVINTPDGNMIASVDRMTGQPTGVVGRAPAHYQVGWWLDENQQPMPYSFSADVPGSQPRSVATGAATPVPPGLLSPEKVAAGTGFAFPSRWRLLRAGPEALEPLAGTVNPAILGTATSTSSAQTEAGTESRILRQRVLPGQSPALQAPGGGGGGATSLGAGGMGGDVAAFMRNPDTRAQVMGTVQAYMNPVLSEAEAKSVLSGATGGKEGTVFSRALREQIRKQIAEDPNKAIKWDAPIAAMAQRARETLGEINYIRNLVTRMEANHELGPVMSRWNEFWTNHVGEDLSSNDDYVELANHIGLLQTAMGFVHGGARGGGSIQMKNSFAKDMNVTKMDANTLRGALRAEERWLNTYANPSLGIQPVGGGPASPTAGGGVNNDVYQQLLQQYGKKK